jgi:anti-sigma-K factor RskA
MNEFEWRRQLRELRQPLSPPQDLWTRIDQALDAVAPAPAAVQAAAASRRHHGWLLAAAGVAAVIVLAGGIAWRMRLATPAAPAAIAVAPWKPADPRLAGAAVELDAAQMELRQAIQQAPDAPGLQRLLERTEQQQSRLQQYEHQAG